MTRRSLLIPRPHGKISYLSFGRITASGNLSQANSRPSVFHMKEVSCAGDPGALLEFHRWQMVSHSLKSSGSLFSNLVTPNPSSFKSTASRNYWLKMWIKHISLAGFTFLLAWQAKWKHREHRSYRTGKEFQGAPPHSP